MKYQRVVGKLELLQSFPCKKQGFPTRMVYLYYISCLSGTLEMCHKVVQTVVVVDYVREMTVIVSLGNSACLNICLSPSEFPNLMLSSLDVKRKFIQEGYTVLLGIVFSLTRKKLFCCRFTESGENCGSGGGGDAWARSDNGRRVNNGCWDAEMFVSVCAGTVSHQPFMYSDSIFLS